LAPGFRRALLAKGISRMRTPRLIHRPRLGYFGGPRPGPLPRRLAVAAYMHSLAALCFRGLALPDFCIEAHPRYQSGSASLLEGWKLALENLPGGVCELVCHPGLFQPGFSEHDRLAERREAELRALTDPQLRRQLERRAVELIDYSHLGPA
jgi:hypothetical protein